MKFFGASKEIYIQLIIFETVAISLCTAKYNFQRIKTTVAKNGEPEPPVLPCGTLRQLNVNDSLTIESPNYSGSENRNYPNAFSCRWRFLLSRCALTVSCPTFRLNDILCDDYMEIKDAAENVTRYCGNRAPSNIKLTKSVEISFRTNPLFNSGGFRCQVICVDDGSSSNGVNAAGALQKAPKVACACGQAVFATKIVNGEETQIGEFPWMASLVRTGSLNPFCGASIINSRYILTAAHCTIGRTPLNTEIILNEHNIETVSETEIIRRKIDYIVQHRNYNSRLDNDVALIRLREAIDFTGRVVPVCLPLENTTDLYADRIATVTGWGLTREDGKEISNVLRKTDVEVITNANCSKSYPNLITPRMLCAYRPETDACQGDSGGPLLVSAESDYTGYWAYNEFWNEEDGSVRNTGFYRYTQVGIVSWGQGCARKGKPGVYSRISEFLPWIQRATADGSYCSD